MERLANQPLDEKVQAQDALVAAIGCIRSIPFGKTGIGWRFELYARHRGRTEALARVRTFEEILKRELDGARAGNQQNCLTGSGPNGRRRSTPPRAEAP